MAGDMTSGDSPEDAGGTTPASGPSVATPAAGSKFQVVFLNLKLDGPTETRIAAAIRRVVMQELANVDFEGDLKVVAPKEVSAALGGPPGDVGHGFVGFVAI